MQIWGLVAGKQVAELTHAQSIAAMQFNPAEYLLATSSKDACVRFWDLQSFKLVDQCEAAQEAASAVCFDEAGQQLVAAYPDGVKVHEYEPAATKHAASASLGDVRVLATDGNIATICAARGNGINIWQYTAPQKAAPPPRSSQAGAAAPHEPPLSAEQKLSSAAVAGGCSVAGVSPAGAAEKASAAEKQQGSDSSEAANDVKVSRWP